MDLTSYYGIDVSAEYDRWFHTDFADMFKDRFGDDKVMTLNVLDPDDNDDSFLYWTEPFRNAMITADIGSDHRVTSSTGTRMNVRGKLRYVLRTRKNSVQAETDHGSRRPGDFPWEGAGIYAPQGSAVRYIGGTSGLAKDEDWEMFLFCVDQLHGMIVMVDVAAKHKYDALRAAKELPDELKYMEGLTLTRYELATFSDAARAAHWEFTHTKGKPPITGKPPWTNND